MVNMGDHYGECADAADEWICDGDGCCSCTMPSSWQSFGREPVAVQVVSSANPAGARIIAPLPLTTLMVLTVCWCCHVRLIMRHAGNAECAHSD